MRAVRFLPVLLLLAACGPRAGTSVESLGRVTGAPPSLILSTRLLAEQGNTLGEVELLQMADGVRLIAHVTGLPAGTYAMHLHAVGRCQAPGFTSAGPHFNPEGRQHGRDNPAGAHAGDLPNIDVGAKGTGDLDLMLPGLRLVDGGQPLLDADGAAVVLHAGPDDYRSDPAGNAGARIACGELKRQ